MAAHVMLMSARAPQIAAPAAPARCIRHHAPSSAVAADNVEDQHHAADATTVTIEREELNGVHEFVLRIDGERLGFLEFTRPDVGVMRIEYVEVSPELRGSGLGQQLVEKAVAFAKDANLRGRSDLLVRSRSDPSDPAMSAAIKSLLSLELAFSTINAPSLSSLATSFRRTTASSRNWRDASSSV